MNICQLSVISSTSYTVYRKPPANSLDAPVSSWSWLLSALQIHTEDIYDLDMLIYYVMSSIYYMKAGYPKLPIMCFSLCWTRSICVRSWFWCFGGQFAISIVMKMKEKPSDQKWESQLWTASVYQFLYGSDQCDQYVTHTHRSVRLGQCLPEGRSTSCLHRFFIFSNDRKLMRHLFYLFFPPAEVKPPRRRRRSSFPQFVRIP